MSSAQLNRQILHDFPTGCPPDEGYGDLLRELAYTKYNPQPSTRSVLVPNKSCQKFHLAPCLLPRDGKDWSRFELVVKIR
jgi:hypothetical protein